MRRGMARRRSRAGGFHKFRVLCGGGEDLVLDEQRRCPIPDKVLSMEVYRNAEGLNIQGHRLRLGG